MTELCLCEGETGRGRGGVYNGGGLAVGGRGRGVRRGGVADGEHYGAPPSYAVRLGGGGVGVPEALRSAGGGAGWHKGAGGWQAGGA